MSAISDNIGLTLPEYGDNLDPGVFYENFTIIDSKIHSLEETATIKLNDGEMSRTNEYWDVRPVYVNVIDFGALPNNGTKKVAFDMTNVKDIISITGVTSKENNSSVLTIPYSTAINVSIDKGYLCVKTNGDRRSYTKTYIMVKYIAKA